MIIVVQGPQNELRFTRELLMKKLSNNNIKFKLCLITSTIRTDKNKYLFRSISKSLIGLNYDYRFFNGDLEQQLNNGNWIKNIEEENGYK